MDYKNNNIINYQYIDYIIKSYVPELQMDKKYEKIKMKLFREAMIHESYNLNISYERLEYLGDAVFHLIITEYLYKRYNEEAEGFLTKLRIRIERGESMADLTEGLNLIEFIQTNDIINDHILEDIFEAFIGAFYINFGMKYVKIFIINLIEKHKNLSEIISNDDNYKDLLLRYFHQRKWGHPIYEEMWEYGKFISIVKDPEENIIGKGVEISKKKSEQIASKNALIKLKVIKNNIIDPNWMDKIDKIEKKDKTDKKTMSVYNPNNKLLTLTYVKMILENYNTYLPNVKVNIKLFYEAMTHRSYLIRTIKNEDDKKLSKISVKLQKRSNERLQFLGDSVIHFIIGEYLYNKYPKAAEGFLTRLRCKLENRDSLFYLATETDIASYILVSQNIEVLHGRNNVNIISGGFESFIGVIYLEFGINIVKQFILEIIRIELDINKIAEEETNYKDLILQLYNKNHWGQPLYKIIKEDGPDHKKIFTMGLYLKNKLMGKGTAPSKKKAEQIASKQMYKNS